LRPDIDRPILRQQRRFTLASPSLIPPSSNTFAMDLKNSLAITAEIVLAHRHLATLRHLLTMPEHQTNELILNEVLSRQGIGSSRNDVRDCLRFLKSVVQLESNLSIA